MQSPRTKLSSVLFLTISVALTSALAAADSASATRRSSSGGFAGGRSSGSSSSSANGMAGGRSGVSRKVSFNENGKQVSIAEDHSGITVTTTETVDGKEQKTEVKAASVQELEAKHPDAYRLYARHLGGATGAARASGGAAATGGGSSDASGRQSASASGRSSGRGASGSGTNRNVSFTENGKTVSITESNESGITVTTTEMVAGKEKKTVVKAANPQQLQKKNPAAYRLYKSRIDGAQSDATAAQGGTARPADAKSLLREQLREQLKQNADNPQMKAMLENMLRDL